MRPSILVCLFTALALVGCVNDASTSSVDLEWDLGSVDFDPDTYTPSADSASSSILAPGSAGETVDVTFPNGQQWTASSSLGTTIMHVDGHPDNRFTVSWIDADDGSLPEPSAELDRFIGEYGDFEPRPAFFTSGPPIESPTLDEWFSQAADGNVDVLELIAEPRVHPDGSALHPSILLTSTTTGVAAIRALEYRPPASPQDDQGDRVLFPVNAPTSTLER